MVGIRNSFAVVDGARRAAVPATTRRRDKAWIVVVARVEGRGWGGLELDCGGMSGVLALGLLWSVMTLVVFVLSPCL